MAILGIAVPGYAQPSDSSASAEWTGHLKLQFLGASYSQESLFHDPLGSTSEDLNLDLRLNLSLRSGRFDLKADGQAIGLYGDTIEYTRGLGGGSPLLLGRFPEDELRFFDLTEVHRDEGRFAGLTRLDRLSIGYTGRKTVLRFGRQAVSWGNGLLYNPMDIFNPFDPTAVDKEYKTGDDMLYTQILRDRGDDVQAVMVFRRDPLTGEVESARGSAALKYHGFLGVGEYDLLVAEHYDDTLLGLGGNRSVGAAGWRAG